MASHTSSERIPITIVCGSKKYDLSVLSSKPHGLPTVDDLQRAAEEASGIPQARQRIIYKGKTMRDPGAMLCEVGIEPHSRVMIVGQRFDPGQDETCAAIQKTMASSQEAAKQLEAVRAEVNGIVGSHLPAHLHPEAIKKLTRTSGGIGEQLVKLLETLDALNLQQDQTEARTRRKAAVQHIQAVLDRVDAMQTELTGLRAKLPKPS